MNATLAQPRKTTAATAASAARLSPGVRKLLLTAHVILSVGWFGVVAASLVLALSAATMEDPAATRATYLALDRVIDVLVLPPPASLSVAAMLTGLILALGTKWGLFRYWWIVAKLVLSAATLLTGMLYVRAWLQQAAAIPTPAEARALLIYASVAHLLMLGAATIISVYKPWGRIGPTPPAGEERATPV